MKNYAWGRTSLDRLATVHPDLQKVAHRAIRISSRKKDGIDFSIPEYGGARTDEEQHSLFLKKVSKADGYEKRSNHQIPKGEKYGYALDVIPFVKHEKVKGNAIYTKHISPKQREIYFNRVAVCMFQAACELGVNLSWGGNWKTWLDHPHYEIRRK